jgi:hypothetical protein
MPPDSLIPRTDDDFRLSEKVNEWCLGMLHMVPKVGNSYIQGPIIFFDSEADLTVFRLRYAGCEIDFIPNFINPTSWTIDFL